MNKVFIIAEAGVNHNGSEKLAFKLIDAAIEAGADAVKFQTFKTKNIITKHAEKAEYQKQATGEDESQYSMIKKLELPYESHYRLKEYCEKNNILFMSTAFDHESLKFLVNEIKVDILKISSGEITNGPLLLAHAQTGKDIILSTGMATLSEIEDALGVIAFGFINPKATHQKCSLQAFQEAYASKEGWRLLKAKLTLLHCTTEYPAPFEDINLKAMKTMNKAFKLDVGYSDHSRGITVPIAASTLGAKVIEKHFTIDKSLDGPDHQASLDPSELKDMVSAIRIVEKVMGTGIKAPVASEIKNKNIARKSLVAAEKIKKGDKYTHHNISCKRPGNGISPMKYWDFLSKKAKLEYSKDSFLYE